MKVWHLLVSFSLLLSAVGCNDPEPIATEAELDSFVLSVKDDLISEVDDWFRQRAGEESQRVIGISGDEIYDIMRHNNKDYFESLDKRLDEVIEQERDSMRAWLLDNWHLSDKEKRRVIASYFPSLLPPTIQPTRSR